MKIIRDGYMSHNYQKKAAIVIKDNFSFILINYFQNLYSFKSWKTFVIKNVKRVGVKYFIKS